MAEVSTIGTKITAKQLLSPSANKFLAVSSEVSSLASDEYYDYLSVSNCEVKSDAEMQDEDGSVWEKFVDFVKFHVISKLSLILLLKVTISTFLFISIHMACIIFRMSSLSTEQERITVMSKIKPVLARQPIPHVVVFQETGTSMIDFTFHYKTSEAVPFADYAELSVRTFIFALATDTGEIYVFNGGSTITKLMLDSENNYPLVESIFEMPEISEQLTDVSRGFKMSQNTVWIHGTNTKSLFWNFDQNTTSQGPTGLFTTNNFCIVPYERNGVYLIESNTFGFLKLRAFNSETKTVSQNYFPGFPIQVGAGSINSCELFHRGKSGIETSLYVYLQQEDAGVMIFHHDFEANSGSYIIMKDAASKYAKLMFLDGTLYLIGAYGSTKSSTIVGLGKYLDEFNEWQVLPKKWIFPKSEPSNEAFLPLPYLVRRYLTFGLE